MDARSRPKVRVAAGVSAGGAGVLRCVVGLVTGAALVAGCDPDGSKPDPADGCTATVSFIDADGDGYGAEASAPCAPGSAAHGGDCDDADPERSPGAAELCSDGVDQDCDGRGCAPSGEPLVDALLTGENGGDVLGDAQVVADLDHDGVNELVMGAPHWDVGTATGAGAIYAVELAESGEIQVGSTDRRVEGVAKSENLGAALLVLDDDGDGVFDLVAGAPGLGDPVSLDGRVYRFEGPISAVSTVESAEGLIHAGEAGEELGTELAAGDADGDGLSELVIGAPGGGAGRVRVVAANFGETEGSSLATWSGGEAVGRVLLVAELDGDGRDDLVVGSPDAYDYEGRVWRLDGDWRGGGDLGDADGVLTGAHGASTLGGALAAGDVDGDGLADLLIGAHRADGGRGAVLVVGAGAEGPAVSAAWAMLDVDGSGADELGSGVTVAGDVDGDGTLDLSIGAPQADDRSGAMYLFYGPIGSGGVHGARITAPLTSGLFGVRTFGPGDLDGDGVPDLFALAPGDCCPEPPGSVGVVWGSRL